MKRCLASQAASLENYKAVNEPVLSYLPGSKERAELEEALQKQANELVDIPIVVGDEEIRTDDVRYQVAVSYFYYKIMFMQFLFAAL